VTTLVLGLDGGDWDRIDPWLRQGLLPNIRAIREEGIYSVSNSVLPPVTCPNWKCYASSKSPGTHDVYWWDLFDRETTSVTIPDSTSFTEPELWDYLNDEGLTTDVINLPMSFPPRSVDGHMIAGGPQAQNTDYTVPREFQSELEAEFDYRVRPAKVINGEARSGIEKALSLLETRCEVTQHLIETHDPDFIHLTLFYLNNIQHFHGSGVPTRQAWQLIDDWVGTFRESAETLFLMSDHGCADIDTEFHINSWLNERGYLTTGSSYVGYLNRLGVTQEKAATILGALNLERVVKNLAPAAIVDRVPTEEGATRQSKFESVNLAASNAIASGQGVVYVLEPPDSRAYTETRQAITAELSQLRTPEGVPVAPKIHRGEELYPNGTPRYRPDIVFEQGPGIHTSDAVGADSVFETPRRWEAENRRDGLFAAVGPNVGSVGRLAPTSILDIAPTVLYAMGLDVPTSFEGTPITEANTTRDEPTYRDPLQSPVEQTNEIEDSSTVQERLSDLGYF